MIDFLLFKTFITPSLLLVFYYIGALLIPLLSWFTVKWLQKNYLSKISEHIHLNSKKLFYFLLFFILSFLCMELFWRMMFEFFIAYFDMHQALMPMNSNK